MRSEQDGDTPSDGQTKLIAVSRARRNGEPRTKMVDHRCTTKLFINRSRKCVVVFTTLALSVIAIANRDNSTQAHVHANTFTAHGGIGLF